MNCIFCKIVKGEIPSKKVFEDEHTLAFLDINPMSTGHTLVIPKKHAENVFEIDEKELAHVHAIAKKIAIQRKNEGAEGVNILQTNGAVAGQSVFHLHVHVIPRKTGDGLRFWPEGKG